MSIKRRQNNKLNEGVLIARAAGSKDFKFSFEDYIKEEIAPRELVGEKAKALMGLMQKELERKAKNG